MLEIVTPAVDTKLTTRDIVKEELGITGTSEDQLIDRLIDQASDFIVSFTGRWFVKETVKETIPAYGFHYLRLTRTPVVSLTSVKFSGYDIDPSSVLIYDAKAGILYKKDGPFTSTQYLVHDVETRLAGYGNPLWEFVYTAGYDPPSVASPSDPMPMDIVRACTDIVKWYYRSKRTDPSVVKRTLGEASETRMQFSVPPTITLMLEQWRRMA